MIYDGSLRTHTQSGSEQCIACLQDLYDIMLLHIPLYFRQKGLVLLARDFPWLANADAL